MFDLPAGAPTRFDVVLLWMALAVAGGLAAGLLSSISLWLGGTIGSLLATPALFDGLVRNPPQGE